LQQSPQNFHRVAFDRRIRPAGKLQDQPLGGPQRPFGTAREAAGPGQEILILTPDKEIPNT
jgi:hypothetical protein